MFGCQPVIWHPDLHGGVNRQSRGDCTMRSRIPQAKRTAMQTKNGTPIFQQPGRDDFDRAPTDKLLGFSRTPYAGHQNSQHFNP